MAEKENLVVASKVKAYIKTTADMKCSAAVIDVLSDKIREMCDTAVEKAKAAKRKTVQEKDF
jgi:histone H3/H4